MRNKVLMLILCLGGSLVGCSSKPDVGDIKAELQEAWGACALVKLGNMKKTNGIENDKTYRMAYSFTLEVLVDADSVKSEATQKELKEKGTVMGCTNQQLMGLQNLAHKDVLTLKKGDVITVSNEVDMIKSEKGWVLQ